MKWFLHPFGGGISLCSLSKLPFGAFPPKQLCRSWTELEGPAQSSFPSHSSISGTQGRAEFTGQLKHTEISGKLNKKMSAPARRAAQD